MEQLMWRCRCVWPDGHVEVTEWETEDGADQMAAECEANEGAAFCEVIEPPLRIDPA